MALVTRRYYRGSLDLEQLRSAVGPTAEVLAGTPLFVDVRVEDSVGGYDVAANEYMQMQNSSFVEEAPANALLNFYGSSSFAAGDSVIVADDPSWQRIDGRVTNPSFFAPVLGLTFGLLNCAVRSDGEGKLDLIEDDFVTPAESKFAVLPTIPNTGGAWQLFSCQTTVPFRSGRYEYSLMGQRSAGTTLLEIRSMVSSLLALATP